MRFVDLPLAKRRMKKTLYEILGVQPDATSEQITEAYQKASGILADNTSHDPNHRIILREAFQTLSNPQRRPAYDASLATPVYDSPIKLKHSNAGDGLAKLQSSSRIKWVIGILLILGVVLWWQTKKFAANKALATKPVVQLSAVRLSPAVDVQGASSLKDVSINGATKTAEQIYAERSLSVALINVFDRMGKQTSLGSGVVIEPGVVITNCHVTQLASQIKVRIGNDLLAATPGTADEEFDLCRLNVPNMTAPAVAIGSIKSLRVGQKVYAIGAPQGLDLTISDGIISSFRNAPGGEVIQTTAPISPGSSGGGLFDASGNLIGIVAFQSRTGQNLNFAIPADWISQMRSRSAMGGGIGELTRPDSGAAPENGAMSR